LIRSHSYKRRSTIRKSFRHSLKKRISYYTTQPQKNFKAEYSIKVLRGIYYIPIPLPTEGVKLFTLQPGFGGVETLLSQIQLEDSSVKDIDILTVNGLRMAKSNHTEELLLDDFTLRINNEQFFYHSPPLSRIGSRVLKVQQSNINDNKFKEIKSAIMEIAKERKVLSYSDFLNACSEKKISEKEAKNILHLLGKMGLIFYSGERIDLNKIYLDPLAIAKQVEKSLQLPDIHLNLKKKNGAFRKIKERF